MNDNYLVLKMCIQWFNTEYTIKKKAERMKVHFFYFGNFRHQRSGKTWSPQIITIRPIGAIYTRKTSFIGSAKLLRIFFFFFLSNCIQVFRERCKTLVLGRMFARALPKHSQHINTFDICGASFIVRRAEQKKTWGSDTVSHNIARHHATAWNTCQFWKRRTSLL